MQYWKTSRQHCRLKVKILGQAEETIKPMLNSLCCDEVWANEKKHDFIRSIQLKSDLYLRYRSMR